MVDFSRMSDDEIVAVINSVDWSALDAICKEAERFIRQRLDRYETLDDAQKAATEAYREFQRQSTNPLASQLRVTVEPGTMGGFYCLRVRP